MTYKRQQEKEIDKDYAEKSSKHIYDHVQWGSKEEKTVHKSS